MERGLLWASVVSAVGLTAMGAIALLVEPPHVRFDQLPQKIGATVSVEARVASLDVRAEGWTRMRLHDGNASLDVIADAPLNVSTGDHVRATGQVSSYAGRLQLRIGSADDVVIIRPWRQDHVPLSRLLDQPWLFRDSNVRTSGIIQARDLVSANHDHGLPLRGTVRHDGPALVEGLFGFDPAHAQFYLEANHIERLEPGP